MTYRSRYDKALRRHAILQRAALLLVGFIIVSAIDFLLLRLLFDPPHQIETHDWYRLLRIQGFVGTWIAAALAFALVDRSWKRAGSVLACPIAAGALAELFKMILGRARPAINSQLLEPGYHFRPLFDGFRDAHNLGLPSSHATVAFAGAFIVSMHIPRAFPVLLALAIGCGYSRVASGAHFPSDVYAGAVLAWITARAFRALTLRTHGPTAVPSTKQ